MAVARVVSFEGVDSDRMAALKSEIEDGERPEGIPATRDDDPPRSRGREAIAIVFFDNEDDYRKGDEILSAMPTIGHAGQADLGHEVRRRSPR